MQPTYLRYTCAVKQSVIALPVSCKRSKCGGFTLIELMVTLFIISILAAIAIPSYRQQIIDNAEKQTQAEMQQIEVDLNRWRASALSYQGFSPNIGVDSNNNPIYGYADTGNTTVYLPIGSTASDYKYRLTLVSDNMAVGEGGAVTTTSLIPASNDSDTDDEVKLDIAAGRSWRMLAVPNNDGLLENANRFLLTSTGLKCSNTSSTELTIVSQDCGNGGRVW